MEMFCQRAYELQGQVLGLEVQRKLLYLLEAAQVELHELGLALRDACARFLLGLGCFQMLSGKIHNCCLGVRHPLKQLAQGLLALAVASASKNDLAKYCMFLQDERRARALLLKLALGIC